jgi:hypothetical protein
MRVIICEGIIRISSTNAKKIEKGIIGRNENKRREGAALFKTSSNI